MAQPNELVYVSPLNERFQVPNLPDKKCPWKDTIGKNVSSPHSKVEWSPPTPVKIYPDVLSLIGNTPLVKLNRIPKEYGVKCNIYVKCEFLNPGGSVKDRMVKRIFEDCERQGLIKPGMTIIEPSSGNTGIAVALMCAIKGYNCIIVMSEKISAEKEAVITSLGGKVVRVPVTASQLTPEGLFGTAHKLHMGIPNSFIFDQFSHPSNPLAHYDITAEEILWQLDGKVDLITFGGGTGGTITGIARKFREKSPNTKIVCFDPVGSSFAYPPDMNETDVTFWEVEGMGYELIPGTLDQKVCDYWIKIGDEEALPMGRKLMKDEGLLAGMSSGSSIAAAIKVALKEDLKEDQNVVCILPDSIRNYMTKFVSDQWMEAKGYAPAVNRFNQKWWDHQVSQIKLRQPVLVEKSDSLEKALSNVQKHNAKGALVMDQEGKFMGVVTTHELKAKIISGLLKPSDEVERCTQRILPKLTKDDIVGRISRILEKDEFAVVVKNLGIDEVPTGVIEQDDLLAYIRSQD